jgi:pyridinium-3,5-biscarboxylic acid mononucleotide synthase
MSESGINLDFQRGARIGLDEAVLCAGKSQAHLAGILDRVAERDGAILMTRLDPAAHESLPAAHRARIDYDALSQTGFFGTVAPPTRTGRVAIVGAGTSDLRVSREAARTLAFAGVRATEIHDVGVAGIWRLMERVPDIVRHPVVIAVAGMDAALISVLGGLVPGIVVGVPTSTGYGVANRGQSALHAALASCAPGVPVMNIDNGYGAACAALRALRLIDAENRT